MTRTLLDHARQAALFLLAVAAFGAARAEPQFLPPQQAYQYQASYAQGELVVRFDIESGYSLYRDRLGFESTTPGVTIGPPNLPVGEDHEDEYFGRQVIYRGQPVVSAKVTFDGPPRPFDVTLKLQGCADAGLCYPPQSWSTRVDAGATAAPAAVAAPDAERKGFDLKRLLGGNAPAEGDFLPVDEAFRLSASSESPDRVTLLFDRHTFE